MQGSRAVSSTISLQLTPVRPMAEVRAGQWIFTIGLLYAVAVSPFIGGVPAGVHAGMAHCADVVALEDTRPVATACEAPRAPSPVSAVAGFIGAGVLTGIGFYWLGFKLPLISQFTLALPSLHRSFVGNIGLFLVLIPVGHFVHGSCSTGAFFNPGLPCAWTRTRRRLFWARCFMPGPTCLSTVRRSFRPPWRQRPEESWRSKTYK